MKRASLKEKIVSLAKLPFAHKQTEHAPDYLYLLFLGLLVVLGLLMLSSASSVQAFQKFDDSYYFLKNQVIKGLIPGIVLFYWAAGLNYRTLKKYAFPLLVFSVALLVMVFIPGLGVTYNNARSWLDFGLFTFQPTELVKLTFLIYLATWFEKRGEKGLRDPQYGLLPFIFVLGVIMLLVMGQPDLGGLIIIIAICLSVYFVAGAPKKFIAGFLLGGLIFSFLAIQLQPYRLARITSFLSPETDPQGIGYHISQSKLAIGSGGILGLGIGKSRQKFSYLPEVYGDSIFAIIAEEMGFIFSLIIVGLFAGLAIRGLKIARRAPDNFGLLLAAGITIWFSFQAFINIGAMVGIMPLTGVPLPFISYGGTALAVSLFAAGIMVNISKQTKA